MRSQRQHDEIGIKTVQTVDKVWIPAGLTLMVSDVLHNFVFSFSWYLEQLLWKDVLYLMARENNFNVSPQAILANLLFDKEFQMLRQVSHKLSSRSNAIRIEWFLFGYFAPLLNQFLHSFFSVLS